MRKVLLVLAVVAICSTLFAQKPAWQPSPGNVTLSIWPHGAPGTQANSAGEIDTTTAKDHLVAGKPVIRLGNVSKPTLTVYTPKGSNTGAAVVVFPGGGYHILAIDLEGTEVCDWLNSIGVTCVLLKYRVPDSGPYPKSSAALQDAQRALGIVRAHADSWHIDPHRIGVLGFSAGGHLAAALSTRFDQRLYDPIDAADQLSCRPDFAVIIYPGYLAVAERPIPIFTSPTKRPRRFSFRRKTIPFTLKMQSSISWHLRMQKFLRKCTSTKKAGTDMACAAPISLSLPGHSWRRHGSEHLR